jgi:acetyltransferase-like isoleucine patch superfamily enzyme
MHFIIKIIICFKKIYLRNKLHILQNNLHKIASIGTGFILDLDTDIKNESGEKWRIQIGSNSRILGAVTCKSSGQISIGNYTNIEENVSIQCLTNIKIGSFCGIAEGTLIADNNNHPTEVTARIEHRIRVSTGGLGYLGLGNGWEMSDTAPVVIGDAVWICGNSTILKGVTIGDGAIVARGSVVTKDVEPYTVVAGNPAKKVKELLQPQESISKIAQRLLA